MKNLMAKLKGMNYKEFALQYGERIGLGVIVFVVLICLYATHWSAYAKSPDQLAEEAQKSEQQVVAPAWPQPKQAEFQVVDYVQEAQGRVKPMEVATFE